MKTGATTVTVEEAQGEPGSPDTNNCRDTGGTACVKIGGGEGGGGGRSG